MRSWFNWLTCVVWLRRHFVDFSVLCRFGQDPIELSTVCGLGLYLTTTCTVRTNATKGDSFLIRLRTRNKPIPFHSLVILVVGCETSRRCGQSSRFSHKRLAQLEISRYCADFILSIFDNLPKLPSHLFYYRTFPTEVFVLLCYVSLSCL